MLNHIQLKDYDYALLYESFVPIILQDDWQNIDGIDCVKEKNYISFLVDTDQFKTMSQVNEMIVKIQTLVGKNIHKQVFKRREWEKTLYNDSKNTKEDLKKVEPDQIKDNALDTQQKWDCLEVIFYGKRKEIVSSLFQNKLILRPHIRLLELEWGKYKYLVLEHSKQHYDSLRQLLRDKSKYPVQEFYEILEEALHIPIQRKAVINAVDHVWGYFKECSMETEKNAYLKQKELYLNKKLDRLELKKFLWELTCKYNEIYLKESYYFFELFFEGNIW